MAAEIENVFIPDLRDKVINSKLLVVGAGGIGCEVLKNLVMSGFKDIEIVRKLFSINQIQLKFHFHNIIF